MVDVDAFFIGMKPALYGNTGSPTMMNNIDKLMKYPHITKNIDIFDDQDFYLFFQTNELKEEFLMKSYRVTPRSAEFHELLGNTLGYPPLAAKFYASCKRNPRMNDYKLYIRYAGIRCTSHVEDLVENATWLWSQYTEEEDMKILIETTFYPVERENIARLDEIRGIKWAHASAV